MKTVIAFVLTAICSSPSAAQPTAEPGAPTTGHESDNKKKSIFDLLNEQARLSLKRTMTGQEQGEPATFSFLRTLDADGDREDSVFSADFALGWKNGQDLLIDKETPFALEFGASIEGHVSSRDSGAQDAWRFRGSLFLDANDIAGADWFLTVSAKYEADQDFETEKIIAEFLLTPTSQELAMGIGKPLFGDEDDPDIEFQWRPYFGLDVGGTSTIGPSAETDETVLRLIGRVRATVHLNALSEAIGAFDTFIFADNTFYYLPVEDDEDSHNFFVAGMEFLLNPNISISLQYKRGEDAPLFKDIETFGVSLGVRF